MSYPIIIYVAVWLVLVIPTARWARNHVKADRHREGDELDFIGSTEAGIYGLIWPALWPLAVAVLIIWAAAWIVGLVIDASMRV